MENQPSEKTPLFSEKEAKKPWWKRIFPKKPDDWGIDQADDWEPPGQDYTRLGGNIRHFKPGELDVHPGHSALRLERRVIHAWFETSEDYIAYLERIGD